MGGKATGLSSRRLVYFMTGLARRRRDSKTKTGGRLGGLTPILDKLRRNCQQLEQEEHQSIDEQIVPAKTKYSGIRQYDPRKPHKWGFKNFVRAGKSGIIYDVFSILVQRVLQLARVLLRVL